MKRWLLIIFGFCYAVGYLMLALGATGAGHGTYIFLAAAVPYIIGLLIFIGIRYFKGELRFTPIRAIHFKLLAGHYGVVIYFVSLSDLPHLHRVWSVSPENIWLPLVWYLAGQIVIWTLIIRRYVTATEA